MNKKPYGLKVENILYRLIYGQSVSFSFKWYLEKYLIHQQRRIKCILKLNLKKY